MLAPFVLGTAVVLFSVLLLILGVVTLAAGLKTDAVDATVVSPSSLATVCSRPPF